MNKVAFIIVLLQAAWLYAQGSLQKYNLPENPGANNRFKMSEYAVWPQKHGDAHTCLWENDKIAAFSITVDDNIAPGLPGRETPRRSFSKT